MHIFHELGYANFNTDKSFNTEVSDIEKIYDRERMKLKDIMGRIPNRICLTSDLWTATTSEGYICLTAHFVDENWKLVSCVLNFCRMKPPHTGIALEAALFDCLKQWGIDKKIFSITLDNASANDNMKDHLKNHLRVQSNLMGNGEFFHVRCSAHILNLIVQEGLKVASEALYKIRESVKYIKSSDGRMVKFNDCVSDAGLSVSTGLRLDVSTRWNTGYFMLESALQYRKAFEIFQVADRNFKHCPSDEEWERAERICEFLEPFYDITNLISGSNYPTANLYFMQVWKVQCLLEKHKVSDDKVIRDMSLDMMVKFEKYWTNYSVVLAFGAILDPRLKVKFLKYCYTKLDALTAEAKLGNLMQKFKMLYEEYVKYFANQNISLSQSSYESISLSNPSRSSQGNKTKKSKFTSDLQDFKAWSSNESNVPEKSEYDIYIAEEYMQVDEENSEEFDVLLYWKVNEKKYPVLSIMARDVLSIPITTVASESSFSIGGRVLTKYRSSTLPEHVQMLICTRSWLHGFSENISDEDESNTEDEGLIDAAGQEDS